LAAHLSEFLGWTPVNVKLLLPPRQSRGISLCISVDRKHDAKWLFPQEKATSHRSQKVYLYSENGLGRRRAVPGEHNCLARLPSVIRS